MVVTSSISGTPTGYAGGGGGNSGNRFYGGTGGSGGSTPSPLGSPGSPQTPGFGGGNGAHLEESICQTAGSGSLTLVVVEESRCSCGGVL